MRRVDLTGEQFGELTALKYLGNKKWECKCSCNNIIAVDTYKLTSGHTKSCGHNTNKFIDLTGKHFGEWDVLRYAGNHLWECQCSCGNIRYVNTVNLRNGKSKSCGHATTGFKDLSNKKFGEWTPIEHLGGGTWRCQCSCGNIGNVKTYDLENGRSKSCGHDYNAFIDLKGKEFGRLLVLEYLGNQNWRCECSCGNITEVNGQRLRNGLTKSCGCSIRSNMMSTSLKRYGTPYTAQKHRTPEQVEMTSQYEDELNTLYPCENRHDRKLLGKYELDLYYPELKLVIEFNGDYWNNDNRKSADYHKNKSILAAGKDVQIIHIFEHEWKNPSTKGKLLDLLDRKFDRLNVTRIHGRDCVIREITNHEAIEFCDRYHLQNGINSQINLGCFNGDELVGVMTFSKPRFNPESDFEIIRLCWKSGITVRGGAEKLFKYFINKYNPESIITYCDFSKFSGEVYRRLGFRFIEVTAPNYKWINADGDVQSRYKTQKHRLIDKGLGTLDQTESQIMESLGYFRVYDCGNMKYIWNKN